MGAGDAGAGGKGRLRQLVTECYRERLAGVLSCDDRITGTVPGACYAKRMAERNGESTRKFRDG
jgi:hypothetical protein